MVNFSIPNSNPATGRISTPSLKRSKRADFLQCGTGLSAATFSRRGGASSCEPSGCITFPKAFGLTTTAESWTLKTFNAQRSILIIGRWALDVGRSAFSFSFSFSRSGGASSCEPARSVAGAPPSTHCLSVRPWTPCSRTLSELDACRAVTLRRRVGCLPRRSARAKAGWMFSCSGRVKGAWWPSRSSKPLLVRQPLDQGRFNSYPLRIFRCRGSCQLPAMGRQRLPLQALSSPKTFQKGGERMSREQIRKLTSLSSCAG
jgi:hypothetical protein